MQQISDSDLRFIVKFELGRLPKSVLRDMLSGHGDTHRRGVEIAAEYLLRRFATWEILVNEPAGPLGSPPNWQGER